MRLFHNINEKILFVANMALSATTNLFSPKNLKHKKIIVVKIDEIGDMISATPVFRLLKEKYPNSKITLLCKPVSGTFMKYNPYIDEIIYSIKEWKDKYSLVVELRGNWKTFLKSIRFFSPRERVDRGTVRFFHRGLNDRETNFQIIKPLIGNVEMPLPEMYSAPEDEEFVNDFINKNQLEKFVIFHATSNLLKKEWPHERFAQLADYVSQNYGFQSVFIGAKSESERIEKLISQMRTNAINVSGEFTLTQLFEFCKEAELYVGNDSGPMHIANVAGTPLVGLFGPVPVGIFYPFGDKSKVIHHSSQGESPMTSISVEEVILNIKELLGK